LSRQFDFPAGRVGGFGVHGCTGGATGAGFGLLYFEPKSNTGMGFRCSALEKYRSDDKKFARIFF
jgi:hypothetical protein